MRRNRLTLARSFIATLSLATFMIVASTAAGPGGLTMSWNTIDGGGGKSTGGSLELQGTIAQPDASVTAMTGGAFSLKGGFWASGPVQGCIGDTNSNGAIDINDLVAVITTWGNCATPCPPTCPADVDQDCHVNINDLVLVITHWGACP